MNTFQSGKNLFQAEDGDLKTIVQVAHKLNALMAALKQYLPHKLSEHCMVTGLKKGKLHITLDSNIWATQFYYVKPNLLSQLRQTPQFAGITQIEHRVDPSLFKENIQPIAQKPASVHLSPDTHGALDALIGHTDGKLRQKLQKLKGHFKST